MTGSNVKFKCKSWIDTFGQRGSKAGGSLITNAFANSMADLVKYVSFCCYISLFCVSGSSCYRRSRFPLHSMFVSLFRILINSILSIPAPHTFLLLVTARRWAWWSLCSWFGAPITWESKLFQTYFDHALNARMFTEVTFNTLNYMHPLIVTHIFNSSFLFVVCVGNLSCCPRAVRRWASLARSWPRSWQRCSHRRKTPPVGLPRRDRARTICWWKEMGPKMTLNRPASNWARWKTNFLSVSIFVKSNCILLRCLSFQIYDGSAKWLFYSVY